MSIKSRLAPKKRCDSNDILSQNLLVHFATKDVQKLVNITYFGIFHSLDIKKRGYHFSIRTADVFGLLDGRDSSLVCWMIFFFFGLSLSLSLSLCARARTHWD